VNRHALLAGMGSLFLIGCATVQSGAAGRASIASRGRHRVLSRPQFGGRAEAYLVRPRGAGPFPLMVLLHGHSWTGVGAKRVLPAADIFAREFCFAGLAVSLPGYGDTKTSAGPLAETTRQVILDAIATAKQLPGIDAKRLYVYGFSRGAVVAAGLINRIDDVKGTLLHSGAYDLPRLYRDTSSFWLRQLLNPSGEAEPQLLVIIYLTHQACCSGRA
jgi:dipeptidyl aminopeptidase/acylaminoacyl peptidase